jgi:hypothetical protein
MKLDELCSVLENFAHALELCHADAGAVRGIRDLSGMFAAKELKKTATFLKIMEQELRSTNTLGSPSLATVIPALSGLRVLIDPVGKKNLKSLDALVAALKAHSDLSVSAFVANVLSAAKPKAKGGKGAPSVDEALVEQYVARLEGALGNEAEFDTAFAELNADSLVGQAEAVAIATKFVGRTAKSTLRPKALDRIRERQNKLMKFKRQSSTSGRSAA